MSYTMKARYLDKFGAEKSLEIQSGCELNQVFKVHDDNNWWFLQLYMGIIKVADFLPQNITLKVQNTSQVKENRN